MTLIDTKAIATLLGLNQEHVSKRVVRAPDFPRPAVQLSLKTRRWEMADVEQWLEKRRKLAAR